MAMTTLREYIEYGIDEERFRDMLRQSVESLKNHRPLAVDASEEECKNNLIYVGVPNKSKIEYDGSPWGKQIKIAGVPVLLYRQRASPDTNGYYFRRMDGSEWYTGNGNATLSPWDAKVLLNQYVGITVNTVVKKQGNSLVLILTDELRQIDADVGDAVKVTVSRE